MKRLVILLFLSIICCSMYAQRHHQSDDEFYNFKTNIYNRNYDYEAIYLKHKYESQAENIMTAGFGICFTVGIGIGILGAFNNWSYWAIVPCEVILLGGITIGGVLWANSVKKKAEQIQVADIYEFNINDNYSMSVCNHYDNLSHRHIPGIGLNITF